MMEIFRQIALRGHQHVLFSDDEKSGLRSIIAIHNTTLGPALGGVRMRLYPSIEKALRDVLRLSRGMTLKAALANLKLGGGKAIIIADPKEVNGKRRQALFRAFGRAVDALGGAYITAEDAGTDVPDLRMVRETTEYVTGVEMGLEGEADPNPSPVTARGVFSGIKACLGHVYDNDNPEGRSIAVQGLGHVGWVLLCHLVEAGMHVVASDPGKPELCGKAQRRGVKIVGPDEIYEQKVDIFSPNADLDGPLNDDTIPQLPSTVRIVAGGANNQLGSRRTHGRVLRQRGILVAPDYAINAGGLIRVYGQIRGWKYTSVLRRADLVGATLTELFARTERKRSLTSTDEVAEELAMARITAVLKGS